MIEDALCRGGEPVIDLSAGSNGAGVWVEAEVQAAPVGDGALVCRRVVLPAFRKACYYAPFQKHAIDPSLELWPEGYNQCHPLPVTDFAGAKRGGIFALLELEGGGFLSLLPVVTASSMAWMRGDEGGLLLEAGHWGTAGWDGDIALLGWARHKNPYAACEAVWQAVLHHPLCAGLAHLRSEKFYPEAFRHLGWCTWEEFKWDINEKVLVDMIRAIDASPAPIRWVLVDDGHIDQGPEAAALPVNGQNGEVPIHESARRLFSFGAHDARFSRGWQAVLEARRHSKVRWMGVWLNFNGYWGGIHARNALGGINDSLIAVRDGALQPAPSPESAAAFYEPLIEQQHRVGFDFVKVDNQAKNVTFYQGCVPNAVEAAMGNHRALESAVDRRLDTMINCMAHNNLCAFSARHSEITRCSEDYKKGDLWRAKHHLNNSFANMVWMGQTVWGDHDMFHSSDATANGVMARSKAISGGPIYLSDHPSRFVMDLIEPLCFEDGSLLQPLAPAVPLPESLFIDSYEDDRAYRVVAPLSHGCAAIAAYNLTHPGHPVHGGIVTEDYRWAGAMLQDGLPEWEVPAEGLIVYDVKRGTTHVLSDGPVAFTIEDFGDEFFILCPIRRGVAVIGREGKFLPPQGVAVLEWDAAGLRVEMREPGALLLWSRTAIPGAEPLGAGLQRLSGGSFALPV